MRESQKTKKQLLLELQEARRQLEILASAKKSSQKPKGKPQRADERYYKAFLSSPDMILISSITSGKYIEVNDSFIHSTGYSHEEIIGRPVGGFNLLVYPADAEKLRRGLEKGGIRSEEFTFRIKSGEIRQWLCSAERVDIDGEPCIISVATDITEFKRMAQALNESEQKLAIAFRSSPQSIGITTLKEGKFIEVNDSMTRFSGYTREELIGHTAGELNLWNNPDERDEILRILKKKKRVDEKELIFRSKNGDLNTVLFSAEIIDLSGQKCLISSTTDLKERKKIEQALQEEKGKFAKAFSSIPVAICLTSMEDSRFLEINDTFPLFTGYNREEIIGHTAYELNLIADEEDAKNIQSNLASTGFIANQRIKARTKSGEIKTGLFSAQTIDISGTRQLIIAISDITDQVKAEKAIENEATLRRLLIQNSKDAIVILDSRGKVFEANRRFCEMLGYKQEETSQLYVWDWDTQWDRDNLVGQIAKVDETGSNFETQHKCKDGTIIDVEISTNGAVFGGEKMVFCVCRDITERKQIERALRESEEKFSKAFHASPLIIAITTIKEGRYIDINENYTISTGYSREELVGHTAVSIGIWADISHREDMFRTLKEYGRINKKEYGFRVKSGEIRTWLFSAEPIMIGEEACLMGAAIDVTEQKQIEAKAREAESLRQVDKLRRELLSNVSHELRTPLASIKGFATMLMDYDKRLKQSEKKEYLQTIDKNADRLVELIEQLLEMSKLGAGMVSIKKKPTNVIRLCNDVIRESRVRQANYRYTLDLPRRLPLIEADERRIRQVLDNLLNNASKYSEAGTEVSLSVRKNGNHLLFVVADHGIGIPKEDISHIFDRMFQSAQKQKNGLPGAGLGLSICKGLIEAHGGDIWIESEEGIGTRCFFTLPIKSAFTGNADEDVLAVIPG